MVFLPMVFVCHPAPHDSPSMTKIRGDGMEQRRGAGGIAEGGTGTRETGKERIAILLFNLDLILYVVCLSVCE